MKHPHESLELKPGTPVLILRGRPARGKPIKACVERLDDELLWLEDTQGTAFEPGEAIWLDVPLAHDARYRAACEVEVASDDHIAVSAEGPWKWERVQQRSLVRIDTPGQSVRIRPCEGESDWAGSEPGSDSAPDGEQEGGLRRMVDLSAGGIRIAARAGFELDQQLICEFELSDLPPFTLTSEVVRIDRERGLVSLKFSDAAEAVCSKILRWIFREQVRHHHRGVQQTADATKT